MNNTLPNSYFEDYPIEFKQINPSDFNEHYDVDEKIQISPNDEGYISDSLMPILEAGYELQNTVVINAGVGQGKSKSIIDLAVKYANDDNYLVVVAVPFNNLIKQYIDDFSTLIDSRLIFNIQELSLINFSNTNNIKNKGIFEITDTDLISKEFSASDYKVHIMTVNALLGNGGEWQGLQSKKRIKYFEKLASACRGGKQLVIIFDEIHDSIYNFKEENIFNLWKFQGFVHKIITVSATYNEASKEVIKYLSELTKKRIQIIESERKRFTERQSRLHVNFYSGYEIEKDARLVSLIEDLVQRNKHFDIMLYSKSLAKKMIKKPKESDKFYVPNILYSVKDKINRCYRDSLNLDANKTYDCKKINVGTNFTTGVNIKAEEHNFIIILPIEAKIDFVSYRGVFTSGLNAVTQSLARQRKKGDIHVFLPTPTRLVEESFPHSFDQKQILKSVFDKFSHDKKTYFTYTDSNLESVIINNEYNELKGNFHDEISLLERIEYTERKGMNRLVFPKKEIFILEKGEKILIKNFFRGDLSGYFLWAAITNQFLNCRLESLDISEKINLSSENLFEEISNIYYNELKFISSLLKFQNDEIEFSHSLTGFELIEYFEEFFFKSFEVRIDVKKLIQADIPKIYKVLLKLVFDLNFESGKELQKLYFKSCVYFSMNVDLNNTFITERLNSNQRDIIKLYQDWWKLVNLLDSEKEKMLLKHKLPNNPPQKFISLFNELDIDNNLEILKSIDKIISKSIIPFKNTLSKQNSKNQRIESFYILLIKTFFDGNQKSTKKATNPVNVYVLEDLKFEESELINLIYNKFPEVIL
jgi:hypothetical protein